MRRLASAALVFVALACSRNSGSTTSTSAVVGASGGSVAGPSGGPSLQIPAGALGGSTTITVDKSSAAAPAGALSAVYVFGPDGTVFAHPVTISFPIAAGTTSASVYWTKQGSSTAYDALPASISGGSASAQVTHFSSGFVGASCTDGAACPASNPCHTAALSCSSGTPVCSDTGNQPDGTACGGGNVCTSGVCGPAPTCTPQACTPSGTADPCKAYTTGCGSTTCAATGNAADGTSCGGGMVCSSGSCIAACVAGATCTPANAVACTTYATVCNSTLTQGTCAASGTMPTGTACGTGHACLSGSCVASRTVTGQLTTRYEIDDGGVTTVEGWPPEQAGAQPTAVLVADSSDAGYTSYPITLDAHSAFSVSNVPTGAYFLQVDAPDTQSLSDGGTAAVIDRTLYEAQTSSLDLSVVIAGRSDRTAATSSTKVAVQLTGIQPYANSDLIRLSSSQASELAGFHGFSWTTPTPAPGDTTVDAGVDWTAVESPYLPDATKGDVSWVYQRKTGNIDGTLPDGGVAHVAWADAVTYAKITDLTLANGTGGTIHAAMSPVSATGTAPGDYKLSQFAALASQVNPAATPSATDSANSNVGPNYLPVAYSTTFPNMPINAALARCCFVLSPPNATDDIDYGTVHYGQFLDSHWIDDAQFIYEFDIPLNAPGASTPTVTINDGYFFVEPVSQLPASIVPIIGPPHAPKINGADAFVARSGVGTQPVISWSAPLLGTPTSYNATVSTASGDHAAGDVLKISVVLFDQTSWRVPAGALKSGFLYQGAITAGTLSGYVLDAPLFRTGQPAHFVATDFGLFSP